MVFELPSLPSASGFYLPFLLSFLCPRGKGEERLSGLLRKYGDEFFVYRRGAKIAENYFIVWRFKDSGEPPEERPPEQIPQPLRDKGFGQRSASYAFKKPTGGLFGLLAILPKRPAFMNCFFSWFMANQICFSI